jgi:phage tail-like protein
MPVFREFDPTPAFTFAVFLEGVEVGLFTGCEGLTNEREVIQHKEGGTNDFVYMFPGRATPARFTLKRGTDPELKLLDWFNQGLVNGKVKRINMSIIVYDRGHNPVQSWDIVDAWPIKYHGPTLRADDTIPAAEEIEIACKSISGKPWEA